MLNSTMAPRFLISQQEWNATNEYGMELYASLHAFVPAYDRLSTSIIAFGVVGNLAALATLLKARPFRTPHFLFYKTIAVAELMYCLNFFLNKLLDEAFGMRGEESTVLGYKTYGAAVYQKVLSRFIYSTVGYLVMYMTIVISVDRFTAIFCSQWYQRTSSRRHRMAVYTCAVSLLLSASVHSWAALFEESVDLVHVPDMSKPGSDAVLAVYIGRVRVQPKAYTSASQAKDVYNGALRVCYPFVLLVLTLGVIAGFVKRQKRRGSLLPGRRNSASEKRERRIERSLFCSLLSVVILTFVQVVPREALRIIEFVQPYNEIVQVKLEDTSLSGADRIYYLDLLIYGHEMLKIAANICAQVDKSAKFYLYILFNRQFREQFVIMCGCPRLIATDRRSENGHTIIGTTIQSSNGFV